MAQLVTQMVCGQLVKVPRWFRTIEIARLLGNWSRLEVRVLTRFLWAKNVSASAMSRQHVVKLCHSFQSGRQDAESRNITRSGRPSSSTTEIITARIGEMVQKDRRVTV
ncbi:uncharacterized protein TNCV_1570361 [Trichonephila clavipes]|uniref:Uncharacterized protein n=1 Tax=Trichonephila clavipes TaxID=2585209 RepID=A0A8X6SK45_TRICX|nr:uncharacterized protein TNCV_1570361 [Trichonephila clavipes]